jgi:hypothetical protein
MPEPVALQADQARPAHVQAACMLRHSCPSWAVHIVLAGAAAASLQGGGWDRRPCSALCTAVGPQCVRWQVEGRHRWACGGFLLNLICVGDCEGTACTLQWAVGPCLRRLVICG